jgi:hypothetical protein
MSFVLFNFPAYNHVRTSKLFLSDELDRLRQNGQPDRQIPNNRTIPPFPANAIVLKTVWWPVQKDTITPMPVWDPESNPQLPGGNPFPTWKRVIAIDPTRSNIPPDETTTIQYHGPRANSHVVSLNAFHYVQLDAQTADNAMQNNQIARAVAEAFGPNRPLRAGDYVVFAGTHLTTKEIDDWVWATFWWHDRPNDGPFASGRPDSIKGPWRNYLMSASYDLNSPTETDNRPHVSFNPWLEAGFRDGGFGSGLVSNCMNCHNRAARPAVGFLPIRRGDPNLQNDPAYAPGGLRVDFLWSFPANVP